MMRTATAVTVSGIALLCCIGLAPAARAAGDVVLANWVMEGETEAASQERELYDQATEALDGRNWDRAIRLFDRVARVKGSRADGALYWKAWAQSRAGNRQDATQTLASLKTSYPTSRWMKDATALEIELRNASGGGVSPDNYEDEELKLIALYGIIENDPDRGVAAVAKILQSSASMTLKERALYLLAESDSPKAGALLRETAKGANPDLQLAAIRLMGVSENRDGMAFLDEVYATTRDREIRFAVLEAWREAEALSKLRRVAENEPDLHLRAAAIIALGDEGDTATLARLYGTAPVEIRNAILNALESADDTAVLEKIMRSEKDPMLRAAAIRRFADASDGAATEALVAMYRAESDRDVRQIILDSLADTDAVGALIQLAKSEKNPELRREIVRHLADMDSKEAQAFLESLLD